jgi:two-component system nitrogen regulation sensor histidine kinase NtrY
MPKPLFRAEAIVDIARQALFLHEVAHPGIRFTLDAPEPSPTLVCDRRQLGQALTNIVKNGVEAIERKCESGPAEGMIAMRIEQPDEYRLTIEVEDNGAGLPAERGQLFEPYFSLRARGTGLGLAIVKKIVEEHFGTIELRDREGGGTIALITLDPQALAPLVDRETDIEEERAPIALTRS